MIDALAQLDEAAGRSVDYIEQPVPRGLSVDPDRMRALSRRVPVLMDEGFTSLSALTSMGEEGWSGVVIKAGKGQTPAVVAAAVARRLGLRVAVQDLTATGAAFVHSVQLARRLHTAGVRVEYNSRQYAPGANSGLRRRMPGLADVVDGRIRTDGLDGRGLYGMSFDGS
jgi:L-alanine-DL-glutamate epimerase-like enolase superfamily enzyme